MKNQEEMVELVADLATAKSQQNITAALEIYHPEIELIVPGSDSYTKGRAEVGIQLEMFFKIFPDYTAGVDQYAFNETVMLATGQVRLTPNIPGKECPLIQLPVFFEFEFRDNKISKEVFVLDMGMVCKKTGILPMDMAGQMKAIFAGLAQQ